MNTLWQWITSLLGLNDDKRELDDFIRTLARVAEPKIELLPGWRRSLLVGARQSRAYAEKLASGLAPALDLSPQGYNADRRVGLMFANPEVLYQTLNGSEALRDYFLRAANGDEAYGLLVMQCQQKSHFGSALRNGQLLDDVAQTAVSFSGHRLVAVCRNEAELKLEAVQRAFHALATVAARRIELQTARLQALGTEKMQLELKLATLSGKALVVDATPENDRLPDTREALLAYLAEVNQELQTLSAVATLEGKLAEVQRVSNAPEHYLAVRSEQLFLDRMGIVRSPSEGEDGIPLDIETMTFGRIEPVERVIMPVRITRQALAAWRERLA
ncbi:hypothetical protein [Craterilacuibacter sp.]|uniref:hypothetical protein n=1 Tax=Craterilacuibacter sp. TaxID=2870909 RepID=UPI003F2A4EAF